LSKSPVEEISKHLDKTDDQVLLILYAHLLIEERLRDIVAQVCRAPQELPPARLSFSQAMFLCRAIIGRQDEPPWEFVRRLNEARNKIVHRLDPGDLDELLVSVIEKLRADYADHLGTPLKRFRVAVVYTCGYLDSLRGSTRLRQAYEEPKE
jgi:hypothetical protein